MNTTNKSSPAMINSKPLEGVEFTYLGSNVTTSNKDINTRISKANQAFVISKVVCKFTGLNIHTKIKLSYINVLSVLLYGPQCWKTVWAIERKLNVFRTQFCKCVLLNY